MNCRICDLDQTKFKFNFSEQLKIYSCSNCGVEFLYPQLTDNEIQELYSESYYQSWGIEGLKENESARQMKMATFQLRMDLIKKYSTSGKILDVGCATGYFLEVAKASNFEPYGVELSEYSAGISKNKFGNEQIFNGKLENSTFGQKMFCAITMFDLIEHVRSPETTLKDATKLLDQNGIILITTPNHSSFSNRLMGKKWTHYKKEHFFYFNRKSLEYVAKNAGLELIYSEHSKKALNLNYLHTQFNVYKHKVFTPIVNGLFAVLPAFLVNKNFYIGIGEITVILKKKI